MLFIDALSDEQVEAMRDGEYAAHAARELQRRADGGSTAESNVREKLRRILGGPRGPKYHQILSCLAVCGEVWEAGADMLRALEPRDFADSQYHVRALIEGVRAPRS